MVKPTEMKTNKEVHDYMTKASEAFAQKIIQEISQAVNRGTLGGMMPAQLSNLITRILALNIGAQEVKLQALHAVVEEMRAKIVELKDRTTPSVLSNSKQSVT